LAVGEFSTLWVIVIGRCGCCGRSQVAEMLLSKNASVNVADGHGSTPLHRAASKGNTTLVKLLLSYQAHPNARDSTGSTPL